MGRPASEIAAEDAALIHYGWGPGKVQRKCGMCHAAFQGAAWAVLCRPHAMGAYEAKVGQAVQP